jgi:hypothetical protein
VGVLLALGSPLAAATLHFVVVETGIGLPPAEEPGSARTGQTVLESSALWEAGLFDVGFEAGHIVSNSPVLRMNRAGGADFPGKEAPRREFPDELRADMEAAAAGGADYFILALLAYPAGNPGGNLRPEGVSLRLYAVPPVRAGTPESGAYRFVYEGNSPLGTIPQGAGASGETGAANGRAASPARTEGELEQAKRLIRGLMPHVKD